ncbi:hypothetical protein [Stenomitos frigidus]|uniref:Uncharacterized protein n=1 Tax=Stenomitos frigidus ULC18 TaxID=2107698 RepID=A0A2T1E6K8_9CYAN|nr:hypothetical protein [Stenomitos frigidus]PSB28382.1 hypothetical protein C7B82_13690 [Stenomitos frigidus ULC18]
MSRDVPVPEINGGLVQSIPQPDVKALTEPFSQAKLFEADSALADDLAAADSVLDHVSQLKAKAKVALIRRLLTQLEADHIQTILEFGLREIGDRHRRGVSSENHNTRLLLKKDYSYQDRGLNEPTQYYVYLRRRKPKLDRYIGTLFYVPQGCALDYFLDVEGRMVFKPPHNVFQLQDSTNPAVNQVVRLICLEPPPADYTFDKQQNDTPDIHLQLEYLDPKTHQPIAKQSYPFPACMHEGGRLDRYRWEVTPLMLAPDTSVLHEPLDRLSILEPLTTEGLLVASPTRAELSHLLPGDAATRLDEFNQGTIATQAAWVDVKPAVSPPELVTPQTTRRVLELPMTRWLTFYLSNDRDSDALLTRMRLWATWSEKAMPQSRWEMVQDGTTYTLMNAHFKRRILRFSSDQTAVAFENSLPVLVRWFHDLGLAVSQAQNQRQYSAAQLQLAHTLFVDMSLPQTDPLVVLKKLFGIEFSKTLPDRR